jgi:hypothetical protein
MSDDIEEKHSENQTNTRSETTSDEIIPIIETDTTETNQETENMEVHHHPDVHHKRKNFKEYFLEFLMIFLAVTMGFFAENIREYFVDKGKEKEYIRSFAEDLSNDEIQLPHLISSIRWQIHAADSLPLILKNVDTKIPANSIYYFLRGMERQQGINIFITDRTIAQVKNAGEMRLIRNKQISDSPIDYYKQIEFVAYLQEALFYMRGGLADALRPLVNSYDYDKISDSLDHLINPQEILHLRSADPGAINNCLLSVSNIKGLSRGIITMIIGIQNKAENLKQLINEKYEIEK